MLQCFLTDRFVTVANESAMEETALCLTDYQQYFTGIVIVNMTDNATEFEPFTTYKIRHLPTLTDREFSYQALFNSCYDAAANNIVL